MENNFYYQSPVPPKKQNSMELAALILAIIGLVTCCCIYVAVPCGALSIIFAFLSQGSNPPGQPYSKNAKLAIILGIVTIIVSILLLIAIFAFTFISGAIDMNTYIQEIEKEMETYNSIYTL